jgi:hypothetical protein
MGCCDRDRRRMAETVLHGFDPREPDPKGNANRLLQLKSAFFPPRKVSQGLGFPCARVGLQAIYAPPRAHAAFDFYPPPKNLNRVRSQ